MSNFFDIWHSTQAKLFPWLEERLDPLSEKEQRFVQVVGTNVSTRTGQSDVYGTRSPDMCAKIQQNICCFLSIRGSCYRELKFIIFSIHINNIVHQVG